MSLPDGNPEYASSGFCAPDDGESGGVEDDITEGTGGGAHASDESCDIAQDENPRDLPFAFCVPDDGESGGVDGDMTEGAGGGAHTSDEACDIAQDEDFPASASQEAQEERQKGRVPEKNRRGRFWSSGWMRLIANRKPDALFLLDKEEDDGEEH